jgi:hypothetical protein
MVEVDWNSLFASFFGMVRIKIAYKDVSKITRKRMFEMKKLYVIQFKVEEESEIHGGVGVEMMMMTMESGMVRTLV